MSPTRSLNDTYRRFTKYPFGLQDFSYPMVGRAKEWSKLESRINDSLAKSGNEILVIRGDYGMGKSFTLARVRDEYSKKPGIYVPAPMSLLSAEQTSKFSVDLSNRLFERIGLREIKRLARRSQSMLVDKITTRAREIFGRLASTDAGEAESAFQEATSLKLQTRDGQALIFGLQFALANDRKRALLWLIDEFEYILVLSKPKLSQLAQTLRELYDRQSDFEKEYGTGTSAKIIFILATSPTGWERLATTAEGSGMRAGLSGTAGVGVAPFHRRVSSSNIINLGPLSRRETRQLIEARMNSRDKAVDPVYIPFTDDYISYVYLLTKGRPDEIVKYCDIVFLEAQRLGLMEVDEQAARKILLELGIRDKPE